MDDIPLGWQYALLALLLVLSGFFSLAETSMMAVNRYRLRALVRQGHRGAQYAQDLLAHTDKLLGVILLGNNLVNAASAMLVAVITIQLFGDDKVALGVGTLVVTFLILVFSEITPKIIGASYPERLATASAHVLRPLLRACYAAVWFVNLFVSALLWLLRLKAPNGEHSQRLSLEELRTLVLESGQFLPTKHQSMLINLFDLESITVEDVMTPRSRIEMLDLASPIETIREQLATSYHTRLPVCQNEPGTVIGIVHLRHVLAAMRGGEMTHEQLRELLAEPYFVPASTPLFSQLAYFQDNRQRLALVVDEYGELLGLVTLEDIIEEIIGEFTTSTPARAGDLQWDDRGSALVEGTSPLRLLNRKLGLGLPLDGPKTLNGLILDHLRDIPESGVSVKIADIAMEIVHTEDRVIRTVRLFRAATGTATQTGS